MDNTTINLKVCRIPKDKNNIEYFGNDGEIIAVLRENYTDKNINTMTPNEIFDEICDYEGLEDYGQWIREMIQSIYEIDLDNISCNKQIK